MFGLTGGILPSSAGPKASRIVRQTLDLPLCGPAVHNTHTAYAAAVPPLTPQPPQDTCDSGGSHTCPGRVHYHYLVAGRAFVNHIGPAIQSRCVHNV